MKKKIGLLFGGRSGEHEVSLVSAGNIAKSFDTELFEIVPLFISRSGNWYGPIPAAEIATAKEEQYADLQVILAAQPGGILLSAKDGHEICRLDGRLALLLLLADEIEATFSRQMKSVFDG